MLDGTIGGSPINAFAINRSAYTVEVGGAAYVRLNHDAAIFLRKSATMSGRFQFLSVLNASVLGAVTGAAVIALRDNTNATRRRQANGLAVIALNEQGNARARRSASGRDVVYTGQTLIITRRISAMFGAVMKYRSTKAVATRRQQLSADALFQTKQSLLISALSPISGSALIKTLEANVIVRRVHLHANPEFRMIGAMNITRRQSLRWLGKLTISGWVKLPHVRFEPVDSYRALQIGTNIRKIEVQRQIHKFYVPAEYPCPAVSRHERSLAVPKFEGGK